MKREKWQNQKAQEESEEIRKLILTTPEYARQPGKVLLDCSVIKLSDKEFLVNGLHNKFIFDSEMKKLTECRDGIVTIIFEGKKIGYILTAGTKIHVVYNDRMFTLEKEHTFSNYSYEIEMTAENETKIYFVDSDKKTVVLDKTSLRMFSLNTLDNSKDHFFSDSSILRLDENKDIENLLRFYTIEEEKTKKIDGVATKVFEPTLMAEIFDKKMSASKAFGYRTAFKIAGAAVISTDDDSTKIIIRIETNSGTYKSLYVDLKNKTKEHEFFKDNGQASIVKIEDKDTGSQEVFLKNDNNNRVECMSKGKAPAGGNKTEMEIYNGQINIYDTNGSTGYSRKIDSNRKQTINADSSYVDYKFQKTAGLCVINKHGKVDSGYGRSGITKSIYITKENKMYLRDIKNNLGWVRFEAIEIKDKFVATLTDTQYNYFENMTVDPQRILQGVTGNPSFYYLKYIFETSMKYIGVDEKLYIVTTVNQSYLKNFFGHYAFKELDESDQRTIKSNIKSIIRSLYATEYDVTSGFKSTKMYKVPKTESNVEAIIDTMRSKTPEEIKKLNVVNKLL